MAKLRSWSERCYMHVRSYQDVRWCTTLLLCQYQNLEWHCCDCACPWLILCTNRSYLMCRRWKIWMINKLHNDNADCSDLNYLHEQYESYEKCSRVYKYKCQISFPPSSLLNQTLRCNTVIVKEFLNTGLMLKMFVTSL